MNSEKGMRKMSSGSGPRTARRRRLLNGHPELGAAAAGARERASEPTSKGRSACVELGDHLLAEGRERRWLGEVAEPYVTPLHAPVGERLEMVD